ncbi:glycosyltransferase family 1 protein [Flavihumibacter sp. ZG627]|uniref:glycosyltransferase family 4 protein n=1 Tax=Flavihumibacter sp. ZG627 TaxID=1463156 RepID=UPI0005807AB5|nr:glycosyltransferase family 1 protein [Flavihumibacter sp. ZG627]KIC92309.1 hypothetical protein HY58_01865 [Flavihumibacter sp. ZG627]
MQHNLYQVGMNASMLDDKPTGTGIFTINLINQLSGLYLAEGKKTFTVFTPTTKELTGEMNIIRLPKYLQSSRFGKTAAVSRFIWNSFIYPFQARKCNILFSPTTHGSFISPNQLITIHDLISLRYNNISNHQRFYFRWLLPMLLRKARLVITVSETSRKDIVELLGCPQKKIHIIHNGYDSSKYFPVTEKSHVIEQQYDVANYLLAVGPTYPHKNFETILYAYKKMGPGDRKAHPLLIAGGKEPYLSSIKKLSHDLQLDNDIKFAGYIPLELMPALYREAKMLLFPSLYEGFGIPLLEAMACGCPVVSSNTTSMPEVCGDAALYFEPTQVELLNQHIYTLLNNEARRNELIVRGLIQAKKFSWEKSALLLKNLLDQPHQNL